MKLFIKNMVCIRCKNVVKSELEKLGIRYTIVELGEVEINDRLSRKMQESLKIALNNFGLEARSMIVRQS